MRTVNWFTGTACLLAICCYATISNSLEKRAGGAPPLSRFEQFKALEGVWTGATVGEHTGGDMKVTYHVTSGGSAVTETIGPGTDHEMVTMITRDKANVSLTHYCAMGNQPHMAAPDSGTGNTVEFKFLSGGNMSSDQDMHMHNVTYTFTDKDHLKAEWTLFDKGQPSGKVSFSLQRAHKK